MIEFLVVDPGNLGVVPVLVGPLQALLAILPALLIAIGGVILSIFNPKAVWNFICLLWRQKIPLLLIAGLLWGLNQVADRFFVPSGNVSAASIDEKVAWSMHRGGSARRGATMQGDDPGHGQVQWSFSDDGIKTFYSSPAIVGDRVYATSARWEFFKKDGAIYSIDAKTGKLVWKYNEDGYRATFSSPSVMGKYLVVGEGLHLTKDARIFCIDLEESEKQRRGVKRWSYETSSHVESSPCIADGKVFCGAGDDGLYCLALEPEGEEAQVLWHKQGKDFPDCESSPVYYDGCVYVGLGLGGQKIVCLDANTGEVKWSLDTPYPVFSSPSIHNGKLYVGMGHGDFINKAEAVKTITAERLRKAGKTPEEIEEAVKDIRPVGEVWCIDLASHQKEWSYSVGRTVLGSIAVADDKLYFGSRDQYVYCLSTDGRLLKKWNAKAPVITSPAVAKSLAYVVTESGRLVGLDKERLNAVWEVNLNSPMSISSPSVGGGHVVVGTNTQGLLSVGKPGLETVAPLWQGERGYPGSGGVTDGSMLPGRGRYAWAYKGDGEAIAQSHTALMAIDGAFYFDCLEKDKHGFVKVTTNEKGSKPKAQWFVETKHPVSIPAAGTGSHVFVVDGTASHSDRQLRSISTQNGHVEQTYPVSDGSGLFMIDHNRLVIHDQRSTISMLDISDPANMRCMWQWQAAGIRGTPLLMGNMLACVADQRLVVLDSKTGIELWEKSLPAPVHGNVIFAADRFWLTSDQGLMGLSLGGHHDDILLNCGAIRSPLVYSGDHLACISKANEVLVIDAFAGFIHKRIANVIGEHAPLLTDDAILYLTDGALMRYDLSTEETELWTKIKASWPGIPQTAMVMVDARVYFATETRGVVCMKAK